jgi:hypothetical protein
MTNKDYIYKRRLLKLADFLDKLPRKRFDYSYWVGNDWQGKENLSCGTTACALGWSTTIPSFRKLGLRLKRHKDGFGTKHNIVCLKGAKIIFGYNAPAVAAHKIFGVNNSEFEYLFVPGGNSFDLNKLGDKATPKQVAAHIRKFVKNKYDNKKKLEVTGSIAIYDSK